MTYVKSKDLDLRHVITVGDFQPKHNPETKKDEIVHYEKQACDLKKKLAKNNAAKMILYNALTKKEYERIFMCETTKEIWKSLLLTHQVNSQVKDNKIDLLLQQYEQFSIPEDESIDSGFAKFNTIRLRVKREKIKSLALKAKKESNDDETSMSGSEDKEYVMAVRDFKKFFIRRGRFIRQPHNKKKSFQKYWDDKKERKCFRCGYLNHLIGECPKPSRNDDKRAFVGGSWSDSDEEIE
ncbi:zf-CCHC domain-containing protein [Tanacetum coccineum]